MDNRPFVDINGILHGIQLNGSMFYNKKYDSSEELIAVITDDVIKYSFESNGMSVDIDTFDNSKENHMDAVNIVEINARIRSFKPVSVTALDVIEVLNILGCDFIGDITTFEFDGNKHFSFY